MPFDQRSLIHREAWFPGCDGQTDRQTNIRTLRLIERIGLRADSLKIFSVTLLTQPGTVAYAAGWGAIIPDDQLGPLAFLIPKEQKRPTVLQVPGPSCSPASRWWT